MPEEQIEIKANEVSEDKEAIINEAVAPVVEKDKAEEQEDSETKEII